MKLTEEKASLKVAQSPEERLKHIVEQEQAWLSLPWDRQKYSTETAQIAATLLSAIAFSDFQEPIDLNLLSDDGSSSAQDMSSGEGDGSSSRDVPNCTGKATRVALRSGSGSHVTKDGKGKRFVQPTTKRNSLLNGDKDDNEVVAREQRHLYQNGRGTKRGADASGTNNGGRPKKVKRPKIGASSTLSAPLPKGTQVACLDEASHRMWVLGCVNRYLPEIKKYEVDDYADGDRQKYVVMKKDLRVIPKRPPQFDMTKPVQAVYPATTVFYPATLVERLGKGLWAVEFDDEDDVDSNKIKEVDGRLILQD